MIHAAKVDVVKMEPPMLTEQMMQIVGCAHRDMRERVLIKDSKSQSQQVLLIEKINKKCSLCKMDP